MDNDLFLNPSQNLDTTSVANLIAKRNNYINIDMREYTMEENTRCIIDNSINNSCFDIHEGDLNGQGNNPTDFI